MRGPSARAATADARPGTASHDSHDTPSKQAEASSSPRPEAFAAASIRVHQRKNTAARASSEAAANSARAAGGKNSQTTSAMPASGRIGSASTPTGQSGDSATAIQPSPCDRLSSIAPHPRRGFPSACRRMGTAAGRQPSLRATSWRRSNRPARNEARLGGEAMPAANRLSSSDRVAMLAAPSRRLASLTRCASIRTSEPRGASGIPPSGSDAPAARAGPGPAASWRDPVPGAGIAASIALEAAVTRRSPRSSTSSGPRSPRPPSRRPPPAVPRKAPWRGRYGRCPRAAGRRPATAREWCWPRRPR